jgi:hypothetical protein
MRLEKHAKARRLNSLLLEWRVKGVVIYDAAVEFGLGSPVANIRSGLSLRG